MMEIFDLTGKVALITGASRGIGRVLAEGLARAGATVIINGRDPTSVEEAVAALRDQGLSARGAPFDITGPLPHPDSLGRVDILINNAGIQKRGPFLTYPDGDWRALMETHVDAAFRMARTFAAGMVERRHGKIINIASLTSTLARPTSMAYATAKGAIVMLTKALAAELAPHDVQANAIAPGFFKTELNRQMIEDPAFTGWLKKRTPAERWGELHELVGAAIFLAAPASSFVNGHILTVDGGFSAVM